MIKILFVDDEALVRKAIVNNIDWETYGVQVVGEAGNGQEALTVLEKIPVDMVITDIRMPVMDGLELHRQICERYPYIRVAIISGYDEFEYARQALQLGACGYLLKPISEDDLLELINDVKEKIYQEHQTAQEALASNRLLHENLTYIRGKFVKELLEGSDSTNEVLKLKAEKIGIELRGPSFGVVLVNIDEYNPKFGEEQGENLQLFAISNIIDEVFPAAMKCAVTYGDQKGIIILFQVKQLQRTMLYEILDKIKNTIKEVVEVHVSMALSDQIGKVSDLPCLYLQSCKAMERRFYGDKGNLYFYEKNQTLKTYNWEEDRLRYERAFLEKLKSRKVEEAYQIVNEALTFFRIHMVASYVCQEYAVYLVHEMCNYLVELGGSIEDLGEDIYIHKKFVLLIQQFAFLDELSEFLKHTVDLVGKQLDQMAEQQYSRMIRMAIQYLEQHYKQNVSLSELADRASVSANYFSKIFKKEVGVNYVEWLNRLRVEKAKMVLIEQTHKVYEVAELVGYSEYKYFITMFKKYTGMTPKQFREQLISS